MNEIKKMFNNTIIYFLGNVLSKIVVFFLLPIYTKYLNPEDYGYYDVSLAYLSVATSVIFFDIWNAILRFMYKNKKKEVTIYSGFVIYLSSLVLYFIILIGVNRVFNIRYFSLLLIYGMMQTMVNYYSFIARGYSKNKIFAISGVVSTFITAIVNIYLIVILNFDFSALYISGIIAYVVQVIILEASTKVVVKFSFKHIDFNIVKELCIYALPLCINSLSYWLLTSYNRIIITNYLSPYENGLYSISGKFSFFITMISNCFLMAWQERAYAEKGTNEQKGRFFSEAFNIYFKVMIIGCLFITPIIWFIYPIIIDNSYSKGINYVPLYIIGTMLNLVSVFLGSIFGNIMKTKYIFISTIIGAIVNVVTGKILIVTLGVNGASIALSLGFLSTIISRVILLNKYIGFKVNIKYMILGSLIMISSIYIYNTNNYYIFLLFLISIPIALISIKNEIRLVLKAIVNKEVKNE